MVSQLEKEALVKGVPIGQAIDIEIPPPRPKRKPSNPYPRKTGAVNSPNSQVKIKDGKQISPGSTEQIVVLEKEQLPEEPGGDDGESNTKEINCVDKCTEGFRLFQETSSALGVSSTEFHATALGSAEKVSNFKEFVPINKSLADNEIRNFNAAEGHNRNHKPNKSDVVEMVQNDSENETNAAKTFPRHAPVQILDGNLGSCSQGLSSDVSYQEPAFHPMGIPGQPAFFGNPAVSAAVESQASTSKSTNHQMFPSPHSPFSLFPNTHENYSSFLHMSSTFSSMIVSALLQNPAANPAASFAASFWPCPNVENSDNSPAGPCEGFPPRQMNPAPSVAAIAAATVAAATAWWAAHGLLPLCAPLHAGVSFPPASVTAPLGNFTQTPDANEEREENNFQFPGPQIQQPKQGLAEALQPQHSASKSPATSSSNSGNASSPKMDIGVEANNDQKVAALSEQKDTSKGKTKKQVDRSSCGSNTPSGSDVETDALEKNDKGKEEANEPDVSRPTTSEPSGRRNRIIGNIYDSWKEVSEGGRLAFQALFSREVLPQSFSPPIVPGKKQEMNDTFEENRQNAGESNCASQLDLNRNTWESWYSNQDIEKIRLREDNRKDELLTFNHDHGKLMTNRTGFKPYKRCSMEARESRVMNSSTPEQEKCSKRLRFDGDAST